MGLQNCFRFFHSKFHTASHPHCFKMILCRNYYQTFIMGKKTCSFLNPYLKKKKKRWFCAFKLMITLLVRENLWSSGKRLKFKLVLGIWKWYEICFVGCVGVIDLSVKHCVWEQKPGLCTAAALLFIGENLGKCWKHEEQEITSQCCKKILLLVIWCL